MIPKDKRIYTTGRRKTSVARVFLSPTGTGKITVNKKEYKDYFPEYYFNQIEAPFRVTSTNNMFDVYCTVKGGGYTGQAQAIRHGIAHALAKLDSDKYRRALKVSGFLTRDDRMVERKKFGFRKARKKEQYSKR